MKTVLCGDREDGSSSTKLISDHPVRGREEANNNHTVEHKILSFCIILQTENWRSIVNTGYDPPLK